MLRHKQIVWHEEQPDGGYGSDRWRRQVPAGNLPALAHNGLMLTDSEVIAEYLEEIWPEPSMQAGTPALRALVRQRGRFHDTRLEPALRSLFGWLGSAADADPGEGKLALMQQRLDQFGQLLALEQGQLEEEKLWLGDCGFAASFLWMDAVEQKSGLAFAWPQQVVFWRQQLESFPAVAAEHACYRPAIAAWLRS